ncbi:uncharacterized protein [Haliotis asinina]|uniref:uncharacterized protein isoform X1 n=1 Tax=Haliotis asinina TaxID=109174 RepID=UPI0035319ED6
MRQRVSSTLLVLMVSYCSGSNVCEKVNLADLKGQANNLCYKDGSREIKCPRNQTLLIPSLLQRVHSPEEYEDPSSCSETVRDNFHDIGRCLLNISDVQEKATYEAAVREVLQECSQKRYCIVESDMTSSIHGLRDLPVGEGNRLPSHLVLMHQCVKEQIVLCESKTQTDKEVYISINRLRMSTLGTSTCTCTVSGGASDVTLLDVRLGNSNRTGLSIGDKTGSVYTAHGGQQTVHYMKEIRMSQTEWSLHLNVVQDHVPDKIWMSVQGYNSTQVTVTCEEPHVATPIPVLLRSSSGEYIVFACVGFVAGLVFSGFTYCTLVKRRSRLSGSSRSGLPGSRSIEGQDNGGAHCSQRGGSRVQQPIGSPDGDDHHYHMPDDTSDHAPAQCNDYYLVPIHRQTR